MIWLSFPSNIQTPQTVIARLEDFLKNFQPYEVKNGGRLNLYYDERSSSYYVMCHLDGHTLAQNHDVEASLDVDEEDEIYKLNREITEDQAAYKAMEQDALNGREL